MTETLLPPNASDWEIAISTVGGERRTLPAHLVASVWNPDTCPAELLTRLAYGLSVDVWDEAWDEVKKRQVCRDAFKLHRLKTTPAGIKAHVALTGAEVKRVTRPPAKGYAYASMTDAQRKAWLDSLAQIRLYPFYSYATAVSRIFADGPGGKQFASTDELSDERYITGFYRKARGRMLYGRRAAYYDQGVEKEITREDTDEFDRVFIPHTTKRKHAGAAFAGHAFGQATDAQDYVVTIRNDASLGLAAVGRGVTVQDTRPQRISQERIAPAPRAFFGRFGRYPTGAPSGYLAASDTTALDEMSLGQNVGSRFYRSSFAPMLIYDRVSLVDPERMGARRTTRAHYGFGRMGIAPYSAELRIHVPMKRGKRRMGQWHGAGFMKKADMAPLTKAIEAVRASKAFRDTIKIDTATYGQVEFSGGLRFGEFTFGEIKEVR